jgi:hypothetical protein
MNMKINANHLRNHQSGGLTQRKRKRKRAAAHRRNKKMNILFWNIEGIGALGRKKQLREPRQKYRVSVICLQQTIKLSFIYGN